MPITNSEFIRVIPFDPPEAVSVELVTRKKRLYSPAETENLLPYLTCLTPEGVQDIIKKGKLTCRNDKTCTTKLDSVGEAIRALDKVVEGLQ